MSYTFTKPNRRVTRVFIHCSASDNPDHDNAATIDRWHKANGWSGIGYHIFGRKAGVFETGRDIEKVPAAQGGNNLNTIAICLHGLAVDLFTQDQFDALRDLCDQINRAYGGGITFHGHCEVANKTCPVFDYRAVLGLDAKGRMTIPIRPMGAISPPAQHRDFGLPELPGRMLKLGDRGEDVKLLQRQLTDLGYLPGTCDGIFGKLTRSAVLALQADNNLVTDGLVGPVTAELLATPAKREQAPERGSASLLSLAGSGSRIAAASLSTGVAGLTLTGGGVLALIEQLTGAVDEAGGIATPAQDLLATHGPVVGGVAIALGLFTAWQSARAGMARVADHRSGKTL
ncbi:peptidoglycan-binding domain-containing protein [Puniceibacterium sp. IMCC21224]|uniref:peptidoglycan recognition protein family protein n=1 Tax=Puniceibacterium sp. IMCC21224 TaxID=1618204 RepID=UPI00065D9AFF|nr:peptidoglycan-binding domain-containing protein [Puniceibacterium sp. IMCC21224]KMK68567.1 putative peptidoglycan-binding domain-containing protein [Puniceibacterium sp. IMCC21224]